MPRFTAVSLEQRGAVLRLVEQTLRNERGLVHKDVAWPMAQYWPVQEGTGGDGSSVRHGVGDNEKAKTITCGSMLR
jgi:hypothetical protein